MLICSSVLRHAFGARDCDNELHCSAPGHGQAVSDIEPMPRLHTCFGCVWTLLCMLSALSTDPLTSCARLCCHCRLCCSVTPLRAVPVEGSEKSPSLDSAPCCRLVCLATQVLLPSFFAVAVLQGAAGGGRVIPGLKASLCTLEIASCPYLSLMADRQCWPNTCVREKRWLMGTPCPRAMHLPSSQISCKHSTQLTSSQSACSDTHAWCSVITTTQLTRALDRTQPRSEAAYTVGLLAPADARTQRAFPKPS
jgi:hypothetical protein